MKDIQYVFMDIDGVLYRGHTPIIGAKEFIDYLTEQEIKFICVTNNSAKTPADYSRKLKRMGINIHQENIINSGIATVEYIKEKYLNQKKEISAYVVGGNGLVSLIKGAGITIKEKNPDLVVVGWDVDFTYDKMKKASLAIQKGAIYIGTNPDTTYPSEGNTTWVWCNTGLITTASGVEPTIIGKPKSLIMEIAAKRISALKEKSLMIGDRIDTDIQAGKNFGIKTALVLSGVVTRSNLQKYEISPDYVFEDMMDLYTKLKNIRKV